MFRPIESNVPILIFFDEYSMLNTATAYLFFKILQLSNVKVYLIFVGDVNQCPPINECTFFPTLIDYCNETFKSTIKHFHLFNPLRFKDEKLKLFVSQVYENVNNVRSLLFDIENNTTRVEISHPLRPQFTILCRTNSACLQYWHAYIKCILTCYPDVRIYNYKCPIRNSDEIHHAFFVPNMKYYFLTNVRDQDYRGPMAIANREECTLLKCMKYGLEMKCLRTNEIFLLKPIWFVDPWHSKDVKIFGFPIHPAIIDNIFQYQGLTIENDGYIDFNHCSQDQDIYTAITRFRHTNQIKGLINL
jgi:hypothetical protein